MKSVKAYRYRWLILLSLVLLILSVEVQWLNLSPVGRVANDYYASQLTLTYVRPVDLLSLTFLVVFVVASIPSSYLLHRLGIRSATWIASGLIIFGSLTKWLYLPTFSLVLVGQFVLAMGQALVLTSITEIVSRWFPIRERGMAVGITSASQYFSLAVVMILSPILVVTKANDPSWGNGFEELMRFYAILSSALALIAALLIRENPPTPSSSLPSSSKVHYRASFKAIKAIPSLRGLMIIFSIGWGVLMTLFIKIDEISEYLGFADSNGFLGIAMLAGGMVGAILLPALSDRFRRRKLFFVFCNVCSIPGILLLVFCQQVGAVFLNSEAIALIGSSIVGLSLLATIPIGSQYAAELGQGINEEVIQGMLLLYSQAACAVILVFSLIVTEQYIPMLLTTLATLLVAGMIGSSFLKESEMIITEDERLNEVINQEIVHLQ
ncbi:MAG: MFS transporter [Sphaerochaetaceae bacterium]